MRSKGIKSFGHFKSFHASLILGKGSSPKITWFESLYSAGSIFKKKVCGRLDEGICIYSFLNLITHYFILSKIKKVVWRTTNVREYLINKDE